MAKTVAVIGIDPGELVWVRTLLLLMRHPDSLIAEMTKQALLYLERNAHDQGRTCVTSTDTTV
ncbi:MAG TPA: hypothetical protein VMB03_27515 [Bryobacteraceae bacterium]|nr:hypothetical protein [Bryobacteraceae bacterium]